MFFGEMASGVHHEAQWWRQMDDPRRHFLLASDQLVRQRVGPAEALGQLVVPGCFDGGKIQIVARLQVGKEIVRHAESMSENL
jgi:hypothetical protein